MHGVRRSALRHYVTKTTGHYHRRGFSFHNHLLDELEERGFISQVTRQGPRSRIPKKPFTDPQTVYAGIDPTGQSLHVGHILPMMSLVHFQIRGHNIIPLIGGATARIGDPSGRSTERPQMDLVRVEENITRLTASVDRFFQRALDYASFRHSGLFSCSPPRIMNNIEWFLNLNFLDFLRIAGTQARVNSMLARESVQSRLKSNQGISFAEFSYQLLQAYDFMTLFQRAGCTIQIGGSDQWGNIVAGIDLISRTNSGINGGATSEKVFGLTTPLLTTSAGEKFGKSAGNAIWLDETMTSVLDFYQFFMKTADEDVERFLKLFTLISLQKIENIRKPELRIAQKVLAEEVTTLVHSANGLRHAQEATRVLFSTDFNNVNAADILAALFGDPRLQHVSSDDLFQVPVSRLAVKHGAARNLINLGGLYLNGSPVSIDQKVSPSDLVGERIVFLRAGKTNHAVLTLV
ncbi:hypothetical protein K488DRAFT_80826 [Vararia minispora EC-137]|uniref:Uncharacterized protein n=1 Tax=Vararia minispora EC-137 TaxID=1314806 RepID=A0ACB8Q8Z5_9AGAM|nr:hypothetical protein K488DRAFT_80826 [Vararia minispora EC-137]